MPGVRSLYGKVALNKERCPSCQTMAFVFDGELACCGRLIEVDPQKYKREVICGIGARPKIPQRLREEIIKSQDGHCLYCELPFGCSITRMKARRQRISSGVFGASLEPKFLRVVLVARIDHMVPWSYQGHHESGNLAAACQVCNGIKSSKCFKTVEEARVYITQEKERKGYI